MTGEEAVPLLADLLDDPGLGVLAGRGLAGIGSAAAIEALVAADPDTAKTGLSEAAKHSERARDVLAERGGCMPLFEAQDPQAFPVAAQKLEEGLARDELWRADVEFAVYVLGQSGDEQYVPLLRSALGRNTQLQLKVAHALARLGSPDGDQALTDLAQDPDSHFRNAAAWALEEVRKERLARDPAAGAAGSSE